MWKATAGHQVSVEAANSNDDDWETDPDFVVSKVVGEPSNAHNPKKRVFQWYQPFSWPFILVQPNRLSNGIVFDANEDLYKYSPSVFKARDFLWIEPLNFRLKRRPKIRVPPPLQKMGGRRVVKGANTSLNLAQCSFDSFKQMYCWKEIKKACRQERQERGAGCPALLCSALISVIGLFVVTSFFLSPS